MYQKNIYKIVRLKGIFSGLGSLIIGLILRKKILEYKYIGFAMILGFVSYGLSIFYVRAQRNFGAAKISAHYSVSPFIVNWERPGEKIFLSLLFILIGTIFVVNDSLKEESYERN